MASGINIDCNYIRLVKHYVPIMLPRPKRKALLRDIDGEVIPIVSVTIGAFE